MIFGMMKKITKPESDRLKEPLKLRNINKMKNNTNRAKVKVEKIKVDGGMEILRGIPMPEDEPRRGVKSAFRKTVEALNVGDAFDTDNVPKHYHALQNKIGVKLIVKKIDNDKFRVWRKS